MSSGRRLVLKLALLLAPAVVCSALVGLGGKSIGALARKMFSRRDALHHHNGVTYVLPRPEWRDPLTSFVEGFRERVTRDHPCAGELRPLTRELTIMLTSHEEFERERREFDLKGGASSHGTSFFDPKANRIVIDVTGVEPGSSIVVNRALSHELAHAVMHYSHESASWSPWLAEGFAQWCEVAEADTKLGSKDMGSMQQANTHARPGALRELLSAGRDHFLDSDRERWNALSRALVTWLIEKRPAQFLEYFQEEAQARSVAPNAFERTVGPIERVEAEWLAWLAEQK